jgi:hypothetical protein
MTSGRWSPSPAQIELVLDCAKARLSLEKTAALLGVGPRTVELFVKRHGLRSGPAKAAAPARSSKPETPRPAPRLPPMVGHFRDFRSRA